MKSTGKKGKYTLATVTNVGTAKKQILYAIAIKAFEIEIKMNNLPREKSQLDDYSSLR